MKYPDSHPKKLVEKIHGFSVRDDYRWLEDGKDPVVLDWIESQNEYTFRSVSNGLHNKLINELEASHKTTYIGSKKRLGKLLFWRQIEHNQDESVLYAKKDKGKTRLLLDPNALSTDDKKASLDYWAPSPTGKYLVYGMSENGDEMSKMYLFDVEKSITMYMVANNASGASFAWRVDETGFYFTKKIDLEDAVKGDERYNERAYFHKVGSPKKDKHIFGEGRHKEYTYSLNLSNDGSLLAIRARRNWQTDEIFILDTKTGEISDLFTQNDAHYSIVLYDKYAYLLTTKDAPRGSILRLSLSKLSSKLSAWQDVLVESDETINRFSLTLNTLIVKYTIAGRSVIKLFDLKGKPLDIQSPLKEHLSLVNYGTNKREDEFYFYAASYTNPVSEYRYRDGEIKKLGQRESTIDSDDYVEETVWYKSKDGTKVPMTIIHKKNIKYDSNNPTIINAYGGFSISRTPRFLRNLVPFLERGGVYAVANIRGGGEFGDKWHKDGIKEKKQNSYDDVIAACEYLVRKKITRPKRLSLLGGSNGGLMVLAVMAQRPELFKAVVAAMPLTDMVRFPDLLIASRWVSEYGDPTKKKDLEYILKYSPYHNISKQNYPAVLVTTATQDTRADPMHARKMTALLQASGTKNRVLLHTDIKTGHAAGGMTDFINEQALMLAFLIEELFD